jgi:uncharacterized protein (TIGR02145 family)
MCTDEQLRVAGCGFVGFPAKMELLRDGSSIIDDESKTWKTQDNRVYFMGGKARVFNYKVTGATIVFTDDEGHKATYVEPSAAQAYAEKVAMEKRKKEMELEKQKQLDEQKRLEAKRQEVLRNTISFTDSRDGKRYRAVKIGNQTWMAENLNYPTDSSWCYENTESNCNKYGRLYDWNTAKTVCPVGWHLPSRAEWDALESAVGSPAGTKLKSTSSWYSGLDDGNGTNDFGFSALAGGLRSANGSFNNSAGHSGYWWTATELGNSSTYNRGMNYSSGNVFVTYFLTKSHGLSVRCLAD